MTTERLTTTQGRARLPDLIQSSFGEKRVFIFTRYGRDLAALVPLSVLDELETFREHASLDRLCARLDEQEPSHDHD